MMLLVASIEILLVLFLLVAAAHKLADRERLGVAAARLTRLPTRYGPALNIAAAVAEISAALSILYEPARFWGGCAAAALWVCYSLLTLAGGEAGLDCGCSFTPSRGHGRRLIAGRAALLSASALSLALFGQGVAPGWFAIAAGGAFLVLIIAVAELAALPSPHREAVQ